MRLFYRLYKVWQNLDFVNYTTGATQFQQGLEQGYIESDLVEISISRDINNIIQTASIPSIPYDNIYRLFAKYDIIEVYYQDELGTILAFSGEIVNKTSSYTKAGVTVSFELNDTLNILSRVRMPYITVPADTSTTTLIDYIQASLDNIGVSDRIQLITNLSMTMLGKFEPSGDLIKSLNEIRSKYALQIYGNRQGNLVVASPEFLWHDTVNVTEIDVLNYPVDVTISNGYSNINCIVTVGFNSKEDKTYITGVALDPITYRMNGGNINYRVEYAFDVYGKTELNKLAINKLLEEQKQFKINIKGLAYNPRQFELGGLVTIKNHPEIDAERTFIIESITENLSKSGGMLMDIALTGFSLGYIPEDILSTEGSTLSILDSDVNFQYTQNYRGQQQ